jgi:transposase
MARLQSRVKSMDGTPIKAGPSGSRKMTDAYMWQVYSEQDEICFLYYQTRAAKHIYYALGLAPAGAVLQTDGYAEYAQFAKKTGLTHAQCWAQARRKIYEAIDMSQMPPNRRSIGLGFCIRSKHRSDSKV